MRIIILKYNNHATIRIDDELDLNTSMGIDGWIGNNKTHIDQQIHLHDKKEAMTWFGKYTKEPWGDEFWGFHDEIIKCFKKAFDIDVIFKT